MSPSIPISKANKTELDLLLGLAQRNQVRSVQVARGACFSASLEFAQKAKSLGIEVDLLRWRVRGDPDFVDHWAIRYTDFFALDLTSVQFDSTAPLLCPLANYPASFDSLRQYPARLFLRRYAAVEMIPSSRLSSGFLWGAGVGMWRHDMLQALCEIDPVAVIATNYRLARMAMVLGLLKLRQSARQRLKTLQGRLR